MYEREKALEYAYRWWNGRNPLFYDFENLGGDCTNFVSQCLFYGGIAMDYSTLGWYYSSLYSRAPAWTGVEEFYNYSTNNNLSIGVKTKICTINNVEIGDVVQIMQNGETDFHHTLLITKIANSYPSLSNIMITGHSFDVLNKPILNFNFSKLRFLKILN